MEGIGTHVLIDEVQATVARDEAGNLLAVLDELNSDTLTNGRVRLLGLKTAVYGNTLDKIRILTEKIIYDIKSYIFSTTIPLDMQEPPRGLAFMWLTE